MAKIKKRHMQTWFLVTKQLFMELSVWVTINLLVKIRSHLAFGLGQKRLQKIWITAVYGPEKDANEECRWKIKKHKVNVKQRYFQKTFTFFIEPSVVLLDSRVNNERPYYLPYHLDLGVFHVNSIQKFLLFYKTLCLTKTLELW